METRNHELAMAELPFNFKSLSIMVVDDHDPIRKAIKRVLIKLGVGQVVECFDGNDAKAALVDQPIDMIISDLYMRRSDGFDLLGFVRNRDLAADIPLIIVTGEASKEDIVKSADLGADDYLLKPFQAPELEKKVTIVLTKYFSPTPLLRKLRIGDRLMMQKKIQDALAAFEEALQLDPTSVRAKYSKAVALLKLNQVEESTKYLETCIRENPAYFRAFGTLADIYMAKGRVPEGLECMRKEVELNPKNVERQMLLAKVLLKRDATEEAMDHFRAALIQDPKHKTALMGMGHALAKSDNLEKALYYFKRVRRYHANATKALESIVDYCAAHNDLKKAELILKDEKNGHPDRVDAYIILSRVLHRQENTGAAIETINEALARHPENQTLYLEKGILCLELKDFESAVNCLTIATKDAPTTPALIAFAEANIGAGKYNEATGILNKLLIHAPTNPTVWQLQADIYKRTGQYLKSLFTYRRALQNGANPMLVQAEMKICNDEAQTRRRGRVKQQRTSKAPPKAS